MQTRKYSVFYLIIETNNILEISGARKGLAPFVVEYQIKNFNTESINKKFVLETPYIQSDFFSSRRSLIIEDISEFIKNFSLKENKKILFKVKWKPVEYLSHQQSWFIQANIVQNEKKASSIRIQGEMGQKKRKKFKKDIPINLDSIKSFNDVIKTIIEIINSKLEDFNPELLSWLIQ